MPKRYSLSKSNWVAYEDVDIQSVSEAIYDQLGARFPMKWVDLEPIVDESDLPDGIKMSDVKKAIEDNHPLA